MWGPYVLSPRAEEARRSQKGLSNYPITPLPPSNAKEADAAKGFSRNLLPLADDGGAHIDCLTGGRGHGCGGVYPAAPEN